MPTIAVRVALTAYDQAANRVTDRTHIRVRPTRRLVVDGDVVLPKAFKVDLIPGAPLPVMHLEVDDATTWAWESKEGNGTTVTFTVSDVTPSADPEATFDVNYADLTQVDPATFAPVPSVPTVGEAIAAEAVAREAADDALAAAMNLKANTADLGTAAGEDATAFATAAQGGKADTALAEQQSGRLSETSQLSTFVALSARTAPGRKIAFAGDSHTSGTGAPDSNRRFAVLTPMCAGTRYFSRNPVVSGVAGNTSAQLLARFDSDILADSEVAHVHVQIGTNDAGGSVTAATFAANVSAMAAKCKASGRTMSIGTVLPRTSGSGTTATRRLEGAYNDWLRSWAGPAGVTLIDTRAALTDTSTGYLSASYSYDGVHVNTEGHILLARTIAARLRAVTPTIPGTPVVSPDINLASNGVMAGGGASTPPTGYFKHSASATGTAPTIGTVSDTSSTLREGAWLQASITADADSFFQILGPGVAKTTYWDVGDSMLLEAQLQIEDVSGFRAAVIAGTASVVLQAAQGVTRLGGQDAVAGTANESLGPVRLPFAGPANGSDVGVLVKVTVPNGVSAKVRLGEVVIRNLTREASITLPV